jgi:hypothetical protein
MDIQSPDHVPNQDLNLGDRDDLAHPVHVRDLDRALDLGLAPSHAPSRLVVLLAAMTIKNQQSKISHVQGQCLLLPKRTKTQ